jgi:tRNA threonylcarbamoyladenosine biosynthesis protein TsaE
VTEVTAELRLRCATLEETWALAAAVAGVCRPGDTVLLVGGLGAGKTTFAQGFARALGVEGPVTSPTFTLVRDYPCRAPHGIDHLLHADVYRLDRLAEVVDLALPEQVEDDGVALVEWGDAAAPALDPHALVVTLERQPRRGDDLTVDAPEPRVVRVRVPGGRWAGRADSLTSAVARFAEPAGSGS